MLEVILALKGEKVKQLRPRGQRVPQVILGSEGLLGEKESMGFLEPQE